MMTESLTLGAIFLIVIKEVASFIRDTFSSQQKQNTQAMQENTLAIVELKVELKFIQRALEKLPEIEKDINVAHQKIRAIEQGRIG